MKKIIHIIATAFICFIAVCFFIEQRSVKNKTEIVKIIAHFDNGIISDSTMIVQVNDIKNESIRKLLSKFHTVELHAIYSNRYDKKGNLKPGIKSTNPGIWLQIILKDNRRAEKLIAKIKNEKGILHAYVEKPISIKPCIAPTDPLYSSQWHLRSLVSANADIDAEQAWDINKGRNDVIIAVCDGGVDYTHPDLDPGNRSRVIAGYDFGNGDNNPMDDLPYVSGSYGGHGTHIAGIIGAIPNNGQVAGVMWNCKIMPVKMVGTGSLEIRYPFGAYNWDFSTTAFPSNVADAMDYAVNNGAHVINLSYGFPDMGFPINEVILRVPLLYDAILNAYNNNVVIVAAMGNDYQNGNPAQYPAKFPEVIAVGNTTNDFPPVRNGSSSTGTHISVSAPGTNIWSTIRGGGTDRKTGTSMSAPVVSGVAGLIISQGMDRGFNLTNDDVRHIIEHTAVDIGTAGFDNETGFGIVNAHNALSLLDEPNELYHYNSVGGTSVKTQTFSQWILLTNRWGLAAGTYYNVDQYKITKHITFDIPFCSTPQVWMRERESKCLSYGNPNSGRPFSIITNVTNTGFDLEYVTYYVRNNSLGQAINKWLPAASASTNVAYTAVGQPDFAASAGPISGPSLICTGSTFSVSNLPPIDSIIWSTGSNLTVYSGQNTNSPTIKATGIGSTWVSVRLVTDCGSITLPQKTVWAGPKASFTGPTFITYGGTGTYTAEQSCGYYEWYLQKEGDSGGILVQTGNPLTLRSVSRYGKVANIEDPVTRKPPPVGSTVYYLWVNAIAPGVGTASSTHLKITANGDVDLVPEDIMMAGMEVSQKSGIEIFPNPATGEATLTIQTPEVNEMVEANTEWELEIYTQSQLLKEKKTNLKGNSTKLQTAGWKEGVYIVRVNFNNKILTGKLVVKK